MSQAQDHIERLMKMLASTAIDNHGNVQDFLRGWQLLGAHLGHRESQEESGILQLDIRNCDQDSSVQLEVDLQDFADWMNDNDPTLFARLMSQAVLDELLLWPDNRSGHSRIRRGRKVGQ